VSISADDFAWRLLTEDDAGRLAFWIARLPELYAKGGRGGAPARRAGKQGDRPRPLPGARWVFLGVLDEFPRIVPLYACFGKSRDADRFLIGMIAAVLPAVESIREAFEIMHWTPVTDSLEHVGYLFKDTDHGYTWMCVPTDSPIQDRELWS
jgi:hypothetical protein